MTATHWRRPGFRVVISLLGALVSHTAALAQADLPVTTAAAYLSVWPGQQQQELLLLPQRYP